MLRSENTHENVVDLHADSFSCHIQLHIICNIGSILSQLCLQGIFKQIPKKSESCEMNNNESWCFHYRVSIQLFNTFSIRDFLHKKTSVKK